MNKKAVIGCVSVLGLSAIYLAGVYYSGQEANKFIQQAVEQAQVQSSGKAFIHVEAKPGFYSSSYQLVYTPTELPESAEEWMGGRDIPFNLEVKHGFWGADSTLVLAEGSLLTKLKTLQTNAASAPFVLETQQRFNPFSKQLAVSGEFETDQFVVQSEEGAATVGAMQMDFDQQGRDFTLDLVMQDSGIDTQDYKLSVKGITGTESGRLDHDDPLQAVMAETLEALFNIEQILVESEVYNVEAKGLRLGVQQSLNDGRMLTSIGYAADSFQVVEAGKTAPAFIDPNLKLSFDLDFAATRELAIMLQGMQSDPDTMHQQMEGILVVADSVTEKGIGADINDLSVGWEGHKAQGSAELDIAPFQASEIMMQPDKIRQYLTLDAQFAVPVAMLEAMPDYNPEQINAFVQMGFVQKQGNNYKVELQLKKGEVTLNGQTVPM
ncbi:DUF945 family protein [Neptunomonas japonica]|uniref:DUF945 family protein n=1 Tax=Neptunomonas japonica TaxID=417574 RepID=UPI0003FA4EE6|nr:DUF945 family protein [Neptunomonas japonica]